MGDGRWKMEDGRWKKWEGGLKVRSGEGDQVRVGSLER